jgi:hypothetical protein
VAFKATSIRPALLATSAVYRFTASSSSASRHRRFDRSASSGYVARDSLDWPESTPTQEEARSFTTESPRYGTANCTARAVDYAYLAF